MYIYVLALDKKVEIFLKKTYDNVFRIINSVFVCFFQQLFDASAAMIAHVHIDNVGELFALFFRHEIAQHVVVGAHQNAVVGVRHTHKFGV